MRIANAARCAASGKENLILQLNGGQEIASNFKKRNKRKILIFSLLREDRKIGKDANPKIISKTNLILKKCHFTYRKEALNDNISSLGCIHVSTV